MVAVHLPKVGQLWGKIRDHFPRTKPSGGSDEVEDLKMVSVCQKSASEKSPALPVTISSVSSRGVVYAWTLNEDRSHTLGRNDSELAIGNPREDVSLRHAASISKLNVGERGSLQGLKDARIRKARETLAAKEDTVDLVKTHRRNRIAYLPALSVVTEGKVSEEKASPISHVPVLTRTLSAPAQQFARLETLHEIDEGKAFKRGYSESSVFPCEKKDKSAKHIIASYQKAMLDESKGANLYERLASMHLEAARNPELSEAQRGNHFINGIHDLQKAIFQGSETAFGDIMSALKGGLKKSETSAEYLMPVNKKESGFWAQVQGHVHYLESMGVEKAFKYHNENSYLANGEFQFHSAAYSIFVAENVRSGSIEASLEKIEDAYYSVINSRNMYIRYDVMSFSDVYI